MAGMFTGYHSHKGRVVGSRLLVMTLYELEILFTSCNFGSRLSLIALHSHLGGSVLLNRAHRTHFELLSSESVI